MSDYPTHPGKDLEARMLSSSVIYVPSADRAFHHRKADEVAKRPVRPRRRFFRR